MKAHNQILFNLNEETSKKQKPVSLRSFLKENAANDFYVKCNDIELKIFELKDDIDKSLQPMFNKLIVDFNTLRMENYKKLGGSTLEEQTLYEVVEENTPEELYRSLINIVEMYNENLMNDEDDVFGGTEDSYANEVLEQNLVDFVQYDLGISMGTYNSTTEEFEGSENFDDTYYKLLDMIKRNDIVAIKKYLGYKGE